MFGPFDAAGALAATTAGIEKITKMATNNMTSGSEDYGASETLSEFASLATTPAQQLIRDTVKNSIG
jgi:hypothetical protein